MLALAAAVTAAVVLSACAGLPTSGPVNAGNEAGFVGPPPDVQFIPLGPQKGASPKQIVQGFIAAATSPDGDWAIARQFLTPAARGGWNPEAGVTIDDFVDRTYTTVGDTSVTLSLTQTASVDATGAYSTTDAAPSPLPYTLAKGSDGQWRIAKAPDGIVLDSDSFADVFTAYSVMYFDPTWTYLVPDVRWFALNPVTRIAQAVATPPASWLAGAVVTAFPDEVKPPPSVPVVDGQAQVELGQKAAGQTVTVLDRMQTQLEASLATAGVTAVAMTANGADLGAAAARTRTARVDSRALVDATSGFGFLTGTGIEPVTGLTAAIAALAPQAPSAIEVSPDRDMAAVRYASGQVARVRAADGKAQVLDQRAGLVAPTVDGLGYVWSVPAAHPADVVAYGADGRAVAVGGAWPAASAIVAMQISRDGTRMVALVESGSQTEVWVAGVVRDASGMPTRLGTPLPLATVVDTGIDLAWIDDATVGVLVRSGADVTLLRQQVGGVGVRSSAPAGVTSVAGGAQSASPWLRAADGTLFVRRGTTWQQAAQGVRVLATQQGAPQ